RRAHGPGPAPRALPAWRESPPVAPAATGSPALAAMSLRLTAIALRPTRRGPASASRKQLPSSSMSVVTSVSPLVRSTTAVSSPGPTGIHGCGWVRPRTQVMKANADEESVGVGMADSAWRLTLGRVGANFQVISPPGRSPPKTVVKLGNVARPAFFPPSPLGRGEQTAAAAPDPFPDTARVVL